MVQGVRQNLVSTHRPKILRSQRDSRNCLELLQAELAMLNRSKKQTGPRVITRTAGDKLNVDADIFVLTELDLADYHANRQPVPWLDLNLIIIETYWQLQYYRALIDTTRQYVIITDSWMSDSEFCQRFDWLPAVDRFYFKYDVYEIFRIMGNSRPEWNTCIMPLASKPHQTFALIGRQDRYRDRFVDRLCALQLEGCLVRYQGNIVYNTAEDCDSRPYNQHEFIELGGYQNCTGSFEIMPGFYQHFRFETVVETTRWHTGGWPFTEYNITEKTLKPMMVGVPAAVLAPVGYYAWLKNRYGIDLTCGMFAPIWDDELCDNTRMTMMLDQIQSFCKSTFADPDPDTISRNRSALMTMMDQNVSEIRRCVDFLRNL